MNTHPLEDRLYGYREIDRILNLTVGTAKRWINGYEAAGLRYDPVVRRRPKATDRATWGEFVEVYYLARFRNAGIPLQKLRATVIAVRETLDADYLFGRDHQNLYVDSGVLEVIAEVQDREGVPFMVQRRTQQPMLLELDDEARKRLDRITYVDGVASSVRPRLDIDTVEVHSGRFFGKPKIVGTGISPDAVARLVRSGTPISTVSEIYKLDEAVIDDSGRFVYGTDWLSAA